MSRFRFSHEPCPICLQADPRCARTECGSGVICFTRAQAVKGQEVGEYVCTNPTAAAGMGSVWYPAELANAKNPVERLRARYRRAAMRGPERQPVPAQAPAPALEQTAVTADDRHRRHLQLLEVLRADHRFAITRDHAEAMAVRLYRDGGASDLQQELQAAGWFSVSQRNQRLAIADPVPGAYRISTGWELRFAQGLYAPVRDEQGRILFWEIRLDQNQNSSGRYKVLSGTACSYHIPESGNEQPLAWHLPPGWAAEAPAGGYSRIALVEGQGIKPAVVAARFGLPVIGCGGSLRGGDRREQLVRYCRLLASGGRLVIYADAGWLLNPMVVAGVTSTVSTLEQVNFQPVIASALPWKKEGKGGVAKRVRLGSDGGEYAGSDPDELEPTAFWQHFREAQPLTTWLEDERTPQASRDAAAQAHVQVDEARRQDRQLRRQTQPNHRKEFNVTPRLAVDEHPPVEFGAGEQLEATLAAIERLRAAEAQRYEEWRQRHMPKLLELAAEAQALTPPFHVWAQDGAELPKEQREELWRFLVMAKRTVELAEHLGVPPAELEAAPDVHGDAAHAAALLGPKGTRFLATKFTKGMWRLPKYRKAAQLIVNTSGTGSGKTHTIAHGAEALRVAVGGERRGGVVYVSPGYRSPAVPELESFVEVPARHNGLIAVDGPNGTMQVIRAPENSKEPLYEEPTCRYAHRLAQVVERGHGINAVSSFCAKRCPYRPERWVEVSESVFEEMTEQQKAAYLAREIAAGRWRRRGGVLEVNVGGDDSCEWPKDMLKLINDTCRPGSARSERVRQLRTCTDGLLGLASYGAGYISRALVVVDEAAQLQGAGTHHVQLDLTTMLKLQREAVRSFEGVPRKQADAPLLRELLEALIGLLDPPAKPKPGFGDHGLGTSECRRAPAVQKALEALVDRYTNPGDGAVHLPDHWLNMKADERGLHKALLLKGDESKRIEAVNAVVPPLLPQLLRAVMPRLLGAQGESLSVDVVKDAKGNITGRVISLEWPRHELGKAFAAAHTTLLLDATTTTAQALALTQLDRHGRFLEVIRQAKPDERPGAQLRLVQVPVSGLGRRRSAKDCERRNALVDAWIRDQQERRGLGPGRLGVIDHKGFCRRGQNEGGWMTQQARGGNSFEGAEALALVGLPIMNLAALERRLEQRYGPGAGDRDGELFREAQANQVAEELVQAVGRPRMERMAPELTVEVWLFTDVALDELCLQKGWPMPEVLSAEALTGAEAVASEVGRGEEVWLAVERHLAEAQARGEALPGSQALACRGAGVPLIAWRREAARRGLSYYQLVRKVNCLGR